MSSTGTGMSPTSLPSDHAITSRLSSNNESRSPESLPENTIQISRRVTRRESFPVSHYSRPLNPTIGVHPHNEPLQHLPTETSPLLDRPFAPVPPIEENVDYNTSADKTSTVNLFQEELIILTKFTIPAFWYAPSFLFFFKVDPSDFFHSTQILEYSLIVVPVISIGHISTTALAAVSLGSMTATFSGYSITKGLTSALDTVLPPAWTSN